MRGTGLNDLNDHLFDVIERIKARNDPNSDQLDTISLEDADKIIDTSKVIVEIAKVKVSAAKIVADYADPTDMMAQNGLIDEPKLIQQ